MSGMHFHLGRRLGALALGAFAGLAIAGEAQRFCGGAVQQGDPTDLENVVGDMTLEHAAQQPASMMTCAMGYLLEKCGDHATANQVFDKCIAAGYVGAMIWKGLLYEDGSGVPQDYAKAAALFKRAAMSGDSDYAPLGKVHYASALYQGRGVPRDEAAALELFRAAAAEGNEDAQEFLRTGHHTADRDQSGAGVGTARSPVTGQRLERIGVPPLPPISLWSGLLLVAAFAAGLLRQARRRFFQSNSQGVQP